jgi:hypothetical protein
MRFTKKDNVYRVVGITGNNDHILGICLSEIDDNTIELIEWDLEIDEKIQASKEKVREQVLSGLKEVNESLQTNY